jgi:hypothetical protein
MRSIVELEDFKGLSTAVPVMVDLTFSNSLLKRHFEMHLQLLRRNPYARTSLARMKSPNFREWTKMGVLPCMDLLLWAEGEDGRIPDSVIADALGPEGEVDEVMVRKTIKPISKGLLDPRSGSRVDFARLRALAYQDAFRWRRSRERTAKSVKH